MSKRWIVFVLFSSAYFMSYFYRSANAVIAPDLSAELSLSAAQLGFMTSLFLPRSQPCRSRWASGWIAGGRAG